MTVLAIDPGSEQSAYVLWDGARVWDHGKDENAGMLDNITTHHGSWCHAVLVVEQIASYGMAVGAEVFDTVWWSGRFHQAWREAEHEAHRMPRREVKLHLCGSAKAKDANIRQALIDRFGGKERAIGKKTAPGPLYGLKADEWQALALAVTWHDTHAEKAATA